jgi:RNA polymerase sigma-70 factor (ECF subfamily)
MSEHTSWGLVLRARAEDSLEARSALDQLAKTYWLPVYGYVRRKVTDPEKALDLTQEFFATFLEKRWIESADRAKGRFRTFLLVVLDRFLSDQYDRERAVKRGGAVQKASLDLEKAERFLRLEPGEGSDPARAFTRQWALSVIRECLETLRGEMESKEQGEPYKAFVRFYGLDGQSTQPTYATVARELGKNEDDVTNFLHRTRAAFRRILEDRILQSVESPAEVRSEIQTLFESLSA